MEPTFAWAARTSANAGRVVSLGGLVVLAAGRDESARLDAQLRGRAGRQGDPGSSIIYASLEDTLVQRHAPEHLWKQLDLREQRGRKQILDTSQRIAEGIRRDRHRATQRYNAAISHQRAAVLRVRQQIECEELALTQLRRSIPRHLAELEARCGVADVAETVRLAALYFIDDAWTTQLAELQEIRDGIHLRALGGQDPASEFHLTALRIFEGFLESVVERTAQFVQHLAAEDVGKDLAAPRAGRPSATWTYMTRDDPFGSAGDRAIRNLAQRFRRSVLKIE